MHSSPPIVLYSHVTIDIICHRGYHMILHDAPFAGQLPHLCCDIGPWLFWLLSASDAARAVGLKSWFPYFCSMDRCQNHIDSVLTGDLGIWIIYLLLSMLGTFLDGVGKPSEIVRPRSYPFSSANPSDLLSWCHSEADPSTETREDGFRDSTGKSSSLSLHRRQILDHFYSNLFHGTPKI